MRVLLKRIALILFLIPFILGAVGYLISGEMLTNSLYASFALYFTNPISDAYNSYIEVARWTAPLVTATAILYALQRVWISILYRIKLIGKQDSVAVYSDEECNILFNKKSGIIYPGDNFIKYARNHIIMFSSDQKSIQFYEMYKRELKRKKVFIGVREFEIGLLDNMEGVDVFDINSSIARLLWKDIAIWKNGQENMDIVIFGSSNLAWAIVSIGLQLNLFSLSQQIKYHFITDNRQFQIKHDDMNLLNKDELHYYTSDDSRVWDVVSKSDMIIVADILDLMTLQTLIAKARDKKVYYYSPNEGDVASHISFGALIPFGRMETVFTDDNIRRKKMIQNAVLLNEYYADKYGTEKDWDALSGFIKASNISLADYGEVIAALSPAKNDKELAELEHIRWCRFHFLNYYVFGVPNDGKSKDVEKRVHKDLVSYDEIEEAEKIKDIEAIMISKKIYTNISD